MLFRSVRQEHQRADVRLALQIGLHVLAVRTAVAEPETHAQSEVDQHVYP